MEQKLQIQWQKFGPDHGKCRKTQTAFEQLHSGKKYFCRIAQSLPDHRHAAGKQLAQAAVQNGPAEPLPLFAALTALQKIRPAQTSPLRSKAPMARHVSESPCWVLMQHAMLTAR